MTTEKQASSKAVGEAEKIRASLIADRRTLLAHVAEKNKPLKVQFAKLREIQDAINILNETIISEQKGS